MKQIKCPACGSDAYREDKTCPRCGARLSRWGGFASGDATKDRDESPASPPKPEAVESSRLKRCVECGQEISRYARRCPRCEALQTGEPPRRSRAAKADWGFEWRWGPEIFGLPLVCVAFGRKDGKLRVAKGVIAVGQFALGLVTFAQFGVGVLFGFGQFIFGLTAVSQFAIAILFGLGQFATGWLAIGQFALGYYALGQLAFGALSCWPKHCPPEAKEFFQDLPRPLLDWFR